MIKKGVISLLICCVLIFSTLGAAVPSVKEEKDIKHYEMVLASTENDYHISTEEATAQIAGTAEKYLSLNQDSYKPAEIPMQKADPFPWVASPGRDLLNWVIHVKYKDEDFYQDVDISIEDFQELYMKHPNYGKILYFDIDSNDPNGDPDDDIMVIIGFYWGVIMYPDGRDYKSIESRFRVRQLETGNYIADGDAFMEVTSELHVNLGLIKETARDRSDTRFTFQTKFSSFVKSIIDRIVQRRANRAISPLKIILERLYARHEQETQDDNSDIQTYDEYDDYISVGAGYRSPDGQEIPLIMEKRFSVAKGLRWRDGTIFKPAIFQHQMSPGHTVTGDDEIEMIYGFRAHEAASGQDKFDADFVVGFKPAVNLKTKFIPKSGYVEYYLNTYVDGWGGWTPRSLPTEMAFSVEINKGEGEDVPKLILDLDKIDEDLADSTGKWFSFDIDIINPNKFTYTASHRFDVGITVDVPGLFSEKVEVKGLPTSVVCKWGIDELAFTITQSSFLAALDVFADVSMSSNINRVTVFYPKFSGSEDAPDSPFLEIGNIPSKQRAYAGGHIDLSKISNVLDVDVGGNAGLSSSGNILDATLYYPKADWYNDPDMPLLDIPGGLPGHASAQADAELRVDLDDLMNPGNRVYGNFEHGFSSNVNQVDVFLPEAEIPILRFTDIPAYAVTRGELKWGVPQGYAYSWRSAQNKDPIELNLEYGDFELYDKLEIRDGQISTSFKIGENGYFNLDTSQHMFKNDFRFKNNDNGNQLLLYVEDVSADDLQTSWDIDTSGGGLQINSLAFDGIVDTIENLEIYLEFESETATFDLDWHVGQSGNFEIEIDQDDELFIDFSDLIPDGDISLDGYLKLDNEFDFDVMWKLERGESPSDPGYFKVNKYHDHANIKELELDIFYKDKYGIELELVNPDLYMDLEWCYDPGFLPPYFYHWFDVLLDCDVWSCYVTWTGINGETHRIWIPEPT